MQTLGVGPLSKPVKRAHVSIGIHPFAAEKFHFHAGVARLKFFYVGLKVFEFGKTLSGQVVD